MVSRCTALPLGADVDATGTIACCGGATAACCAAGKGAGANGDAVDVVALLGLPDPAGRFFAAVSTSASAAAGRLLVAFIFAATAAVGFGGVLALALALALPLPFFFAGSTVSVASSSPVTASGN